MKALTVLPKKDHTLQLKEVPEPILKDDDLLCELLMVGICGTDVEISKGLYGEAPAGSEYLIIGHESLGKVIQAPASSKFKAGDLIVGIVRRPDPVPCPHCAIGEWDRCENDLYQERGIKGLHGYASERFRLEEKYSVKLDSSLAAVGVLMEPTTVVAKAWEQIMLLAKRSAVPPKTALITGAGPVGLLAAMIGVQKGLKVHVLDQVTEGPKVDLVKSLGATYHSNLESLEKSKIEFDVSLECTGVPEVVLNLFQHIKSDGILCLTGISSGGRDFPTDIGALNLKIVLQNELIFGSVNANRLHYEQAQQYLLAANLEWLEKLITRKVPFLKWQDGFQKQKTDIKVVLVPENQHAEGHF
jgi:threonine dehydrogenase-like Zn-dependent dehydrogenase